MNCAAATTPSQIGSCGQLEDEPRLGDLLHPRADQRDRLAAEEQPVVAVLEGGRSRRSPTRRRGSSESRPIIDRPRGSASASPTRAPDAAAGRRRARRGGRRGVARAPAPRRSSSRGGRPWSRGSRSGDRSGRGASTMSARRSSGSPVWRKRSRLRSRAASSSSSWPIWASENPASSRRLRMNCSRSRSDGVVEAVVAVRAGRRLEQADLLVVADRAGRQAGLGRDLVDTERAGCRWGAGHLPPMLPQP